jgi:hypothetical protein
METKQDVAPDVMQSILETLNNLGVQMNKLNDRMDKLEVKSKPSRNLEAQLLSRVHL